MPRTDPNRPEPRVPPYEGLEKKFTGKTHICFSKKLFSLSLPLSISSALSALCSIVKRKVTDRGTALALFFE